MIGPSPATPRPEEAVIAGFDAATAPTATDVHGSLAVHLDKDWQVGGKQNGGYLLALLGRCAVAAVGEQYPYPVAASAHYLSAPEQGPAEVDVTVLRTGRGTAQARVVLRAGGRACVEGVVTCGAIEGDVWWDDVPVPELPSEQDCPRLPVDSPGLHVPLLGVLAERLDPATLGWVDGKPSGRGELRGWVRFDDGREPDPLALLAMVDCLPPATFDLGVYGWVPTLELTCYVRAVPAPGPLVVRQRARHIAAGRLDEECDVWDSTGRLVASGHQLAGIRVPG